MLITWVWRTLWIDSWPPVGQASRGQHHWIRRSEETWNEGRNLDLAFYEKCDMIWCIIPKRVNQNSIDNTWARPNSEILSSEFAHVSHCLFQRDISKWMQALSSFIREMVLNDFASEVNRCTERTDNFCCSTSHHWKNCTMNGSVVE